ncbi:MAG: hypothetical protein R3C53_19120 [Pirellulaceae bacterium]
MNAVQSRLTLNILVVHSDTWADERVREFRNGVEQVARKVEESIRSTLPIVQLVPNVVPAVKALTGSVLYDVVAVIDISDFDTKLAVLGGRMQGAAVPSVFVAREGSIDSWQHFNAHDNDVVRYENVENLFEHGSELERRLIRSISQSRIHRELIYRFWFPRETATIWVVCPKIHEPGEFADRSSPDYTYLDNLGDTDALLGLMVFLSQYYPNATIQHFNSEDLPEGHTCSNLVVIGGPGSDEISNTVCKDMMSTVKSQIAYAADCEKMSVVCDGIVASDLQADYRFRKTTHRGLIENLKRLFNRNSCKPNELTADWGYFARFANPLNENATVLLVNGIHTAGVAGAAMAFGERQEAMRNFEAVHTSGVDVKNFECYFRVPVLNGQVRLPLIESSKVIGIEQAKSQATPTTAVGTHHRSSIRILFVAGDRGGSQVNQLQIPNEYYAIQTASRRSEHKDVIDVRPPILAATRLRLSEAYLERPTVVHFAGHGNDRSLSIIDDRGAIANVIPLDGDQLKKLLQTLSESLRLCVLNSCRSLGLAQFVVQEGVVGFAIGWPGIIDDSAAIAFSESLYGAIGQGLCLAKSLELAKVACGVTEEPILFSRNGSNDKVPFIDIGVET